MMVSDLRVLDTLRAARTALAHAAEMGQQTRNSLDECRWDTARGQFSSADRAMREADDLIRQAIERITGRTGVV